VRELKAEKCRTRDRRLYVVLVSDHKGRRADPSGRKGTVPPVQGWISTTRSDHNVAVKPYMTTVTKRHIFTARVSLFTAAACYTFSAWCLCAGAFLSVD
jgi:hypothetical protein